VDIEIQEVAQEDKPVLRALMELYQYDYSEFSGDDVSDHGQFGYRYLDQYWTEEGRQPFVVRLDGKLGGLVLVRSYLTDSGQTGHVIAEFFIMRKYRRQGVGRRVAHMMFDRFPGEWSVSQEDINPTAQRFWRQVIGEYTGGKYTEIHLEDRGRTEQHFTARPR
jgi:predicted acetyltransferase